MNEYDIKYVHPIAHPLMRDIGVQFGGVDSADRGVKDSVDVYTPVIIVNRGFHTKPNANYLNHLNPEFAKQEKASKVYSSGTIVGSVRQFSSYEGDASSPIQQKSSQRQPGLGKAPVVGHSDGGNLGIYSHSRSPLRNSSVARQRERERSSSSIKRDGSPTKNASATKGIDDLRSKHRFPPFQTMPIRKDNELLWENLRS